MTGGRLLRAADFIGEDDFLTYGDGWKYRFGSTAEISSFPWLRSYTTRISAGSIWCSRGRRTSGRIIEFMEKPSGDGGRINGGFFVLGSKIFDLLEGDDCVLEQEPLMTLASNNELFAYQHDGFWQPMDTLRDKQYLEKLWGAGDAPWRVW